MRREYLIHLCDYWEWYVAVRVARVQELVKDAESSYASLLTNGYGGVR